LLHRYLIAHRLAASLMFTARGTSNHEYFIPGLEFGFN
jgi:hypothetical protein